MVPRSGRLGQTLEPPGRLARSARRSVRPERRGPRDERGDRYLPFPGPALTRRAIAKVQQAVAADVSRRTIPERNPAPTNVGGYFVNGPAPSRRVTGVE
jgi:hypothetical protein